MTILAPNLRPSLASARLPAAPVYLVFWILLALPSQGLGHLIDEVAVNIIMDLQTEDRQNFELTYVLNESQVTNYYEQAKAIGLAKDRSDQDFSRRLAIAFDFKHCTITPLPPAQVRVPFPREGFIGYRLRMRCDAPQDALQINRVDYSRAKTRTTLYVSVRVKGEKPRQILVPPRMEKMSVPVSSKAAWIAPHKNDRSKWGKGPAGSRREPRDLGLAGNLPSDPIEASRLPPAGAAIVPTWRRVLRPPPMPILLAWAREGVHHLMTGADHLLFLVAIALAAARLSGLLGAVFSFSLGHMISMTLTLLLDLPPSRLVEVLIALSISWAGWRMRRPLARRARSTALGAGLFGLIHGLGFGVGLKALVGGTDGILWPILSFGLGLDLAQTIWALTLMAAWTPVRRALRASTPSTWAPRTHQLGGLLIAAAGGVFAVFAIKG